MVSRAPRLAALALGCAAACIGAASAAGAVVPLNSSTFDGFVAAHESVLLLFYAPWCGHSRALLPQFEHAARLEGAAGGRLCPFGTVDGSENDDLAARFDVQGYPTVLLLRRAAAAPPKEYRGAREARALAAWVGAQLAPELGAVGSAEEAWRLARTARAAAIALLPAAAPPTLRAAVLLSAAELDGLAWAEAADAAALGEALGAAPPAVVVLSALSDEPEVFDLAAPAPDAADAADGAQQRARDAHGGARADEGAAAALARALVEWTDAAAVPLLAPYAEERAEALFGTRAQYHALLLHADPDPPDGAGAPSAARAALEASVRAAALGLRGQFTFLSVALAQAAELGEYVGVAADAPRGGGALPPPALAVVEAGSARKWRYSGAPDDRAAVAAFLERVRFGLEPAWLRSAPRAAGAPPFPPPQPGAVIELSGAELGALLSQPQGPGGVRYLLLLLYAPWCGHSKRFEATYAELARELAGAAHTMVARLDGTANDLPAAAAPGAGAGSALGVGEVGAYPTLLLYAPRPSAELGWAEPVEYTGTRGRGAVLQWALAEMAEADRPWLGEGAAREAEAPASAEGPAGAGARQPLHGTADAAAPKQEL